MQRYRGPRSSDTRPTRVDTAFVPGFPTPTGMVAGKPTLGSPINPYHAIDIDDELITLQESLGLTAADPVDGVGQIGPALLSTLRGERDLEGDEIEFSRVYPPAAAVQNASGWILDAAKNYWSANSFEAGALLVPLTGLPTGSAITGFDVHLEGIAGGGTVHIYQCTAPFAQSIIDVELQNRGSHEFDTGVATYSFNISPAITVTDDKVITIRVLAEEIDEGATFIFRGLTVNLTRTRIAL